MFHVEDFLPLVFWNGIMSALAIAVLVTILTQFKRKNPERLAGFAWLGAIVVIIVLLVSGKHFQVFYQQTEVNQWKYARSSEARVPFSLLGEETDYQVIYFGNDPLEKKSAKKARVYRPDGFTDDKQLIISWPGLFGKRINYWYSVSGARGEFDVLEALVMSGIKEDSDIKEIWFYKDSTDAEFQIEDRNDVSDFYEIISAMNKIQAEELNENLYQLYPENSLDDYMQGAWTITVFDSIEVGSMAVIQFEYDPHYQIMELHLVNSIAYYSLTDAQNEKVLQLISDDLNQ